VSERERDEEPGGSTPAGPRAAGEYGASRDVLEQLRLPRDGAGDIAARRRRWPWIVATLAAVVVLAWAAWLAAEGPMPVETARAVPLGEVAGEAVPVLSGSGYLVPARPFIAVGSRVSGRIARYLVDEGDRVRAGQAMVELDPKPFQATVDQVRASLRSARAQLDLAESELARAERLVEQGVLAEEDYDRRRSEARVGRARVAELKASLQRAETDLEDAVIRAPTDGVVLETYKQPGEIAVPGGFSGSGDLLRLANLSELRAELDVNESDLTRVSLGQAAEIVPDAFPERTYAGRVVKLAPQIDRQKGTREVEVVVVDPDDRLLPDMSVRVVFFESLPQPSGSAKASTVVPRGALRRDDEARPFVWTVRDGHADRATVEVDRVLGDRVVLASGLAGGERVIVGEPPDRAGRSVEATAVDGDAS
jgi:RND family efflux transporter MFP subunit